MRDYVKFAAAGGRSAPFNRFLRPVLAMALGLCVLAAQGSSGTPGPGYEKPDAVAAPLAKTKRSKTPTVSLSVSPATVIEGESVTLSWSSTNATSCTASEGWSGARATSGSETVAGLRASTTFGLSCRGKKGSASQSVNVVVKATVLTSGLVYRRDGSVAYGPGFSPSSGIAGAEVSLLGSSTLTDSSGAYSLRTVEPSDGNRYALITAKAAGYALSWYPWSIGGSANSRALALYDEVAATPRPGFLLGMIPHDVGGFMNRVFSAGLFPSTYDRIKNVVGANVVTLVDTIWINRLDVRNGVVELASNSTNLGSGNVMSPDRAMYQVLVPQARERGLQVMIMIGLYPDPAVGSRYWEEMGTLKPTDTAAWDAWFSAYRPLIIERAQIARDLGVEHLSFFGQWSRSPVRYWRDVVDAIRGTGFTGKISFLGGVDMANSWHQYRDQEYFLGRDQVLDFMGLWDYVGLSVYDGVRKSRPDEVLDRAQPRERIRESVQWLLQDMSYSPKPLMIMVGTPSVHGGVSNGEYIEPCVVCDSVAPQRQRDLEQQADMYQAVCEAIDATPVGNGRVMGLLSWGYHFRDDFTYIVNPGDSAYDKSGSIRAKPAEAVVSNWFKRWVR